MSEKTMWVLKREITLCVGDDVEYADIIRTLKSKQLFSSEKCARLNAQKEQETLVAAMKTSEDTVMNLGGLIFDADDVKCAKISVRKAEDYEIKGMSEFAEEDDDERADCCCDSCDCNKANSDEIPGAKCIPDDDGDDDECTGVNCDSGMKPPAGYGEGAPEED